MVSKICLLAAIFGVCGAAPNQEAWRHKCGKAETSSNFEQMSTKGVIFSPLSSAEINEIVQWLLSNPSLNLTTRMNASLSDNYIFRVSFAPPVKAAALNYLDNSGPVPERRANVILQMGGLKKPVVREYIIGPLPIQPKTTMTQVSYGPVKDIPFDARLQNGIEYAAIDVIFVQAANELKDVLLDSYGAAYYDTVYSTGSCPTGVAVCLTYADTSPRGPNRDYIFQWSFLLDFQAENDIGLYFVVRTQGSDVSQWKITTVIYNGQLFPGVQAFKTAYQTGNCIKMANRPLLAALQTGGLDWSVLQKKNKARPNSNVAAPQVQEPGGKRFFVKDNQIEYLGWEFHIGHNMVAGIQMFDVRFKGQRVAYEIALVEALAGYSGVHDAEQAGCLYIDSAWGLGYLLSPVILGVDCPATAHRLDVTYLIDSDSPITMPKVVCVFEEAGEMPLQRHWGFATGTDYVSGTAKSALVVRSLITAWNYDYVIDYVFHLNGVIELRTAASGYLQATFWSEQLRTDVDTFGQRIHESTAGTIHDHIFNFKIDFDLFGTSNSVVKTKVEYVPEVPRDINNVPYSSAISSFQTFKGFVAKKINRTILTEEAGIVMDLNAQEGYSVVNEDNVNSYGYPRGYKLKFHETTTTPLAHTAMYKAATFGKYNLAVTQRKETEIYPTSIFDQSDTTGTIMNATHPTPLVTLDDYLNKESINKQDIVVWANIGTYHIPSAEDDPVTHTLGNTNSLLLLPVNLFDSDQVFDLGNTVVVSPVHKTVAAPTNKKSTPLTHPAMSPAINLNGLKTREQYMCPMKYHPLADDFQFLQAGAALPAA